jgi:MFS transporter, DHA1 family, tetracycline resistance protein
MFKFGWSTAVVGASLAFVGVTMAVSQATLPRVLIPRLGEAKCVMLGLTSGLIGFLGYAFATRSWMMFALLLTWFFGALAMPSTNALMSHRIPVSAQGELQGAVASLFSLSSILGPPLMTQLFGYFSSGGAPIRFPGAAFMASALLTVGSMLLFRRAIGSETSRVPQPQGPAATPPETVSATAP